LGQRRFNLLQLLIDGNPQRLECACGGMYACASSPTHGLLHNGSQAGCGCNGTVAHNRPCNGAAAMLFPVAKDRVGDLFFIPCINDVGGAGAVERIKAHVQRPISQTKSHVRPCQAEAAYAQIEQNRINSGEAGSLSCGFNLHEPPGHNHKPLLCNGLRQPLACAAARRRVCVNAQHSAVRCGSGEDGAGVASSAQRAVYHQ
jgi:hypothetical protein